MNTRKPTAKLQLGFSPLSKTIRLAKMRDDGEGRRILVGSRELAWEAVKEAVDHENWTFGDALTYFGFYCWGWDMRRQYDEQTAN